MTALFSFFNRIGLDRILGSEGDADGISVWIFALLAILGGASAVFGGRIIRKKASRRSCMLRLSYCSRVIEMRAMCDSGNLLSEPISGLPCIVVELRALGGFLGERLARAAESGETEGLSSDEARRIRIVPCVSVGGSQMLYAFRVDAIELDFGKGACGVDALVALSPTPINADGCRAIVPSELCFGV